MSAEEAGRRRQEQQHMPSNEEWESLEKWRWEENSTGEGRRPISHMNCK
jgi:hypothetical protein